MKIKSEKKWIQENIVFIEFVIDLIKVKYNYKNIPDYEIMKILYDYSD